MLLGIDLNSLDVDSLLGPLARRGKCGNGKNWSRQTTQKPILLNIFLSWNSGKDQLNGSLPIDCNTRGSKAGLSFRPLSCKDVEFDADFYCFLVLRGYVARQRPPRVGVEGTRTPRWQLKFSNPRVYRISPLPSLNDIFPILRADEVISAQKKALEQLESEDIYSNLCKSVQKTKSINSIQSQVTMESILNDTCIVPNRTMIHDHVCLADAFPWNAQMRPALPRALKAKAILQHSAVANSSSNNRQHGPRLPIAWLMDLLWLVVNVEIAFDSQQGMPRGKQLPLLWKF